MFFCYFFSIAPKYLKSNGITRTCISVTWASQPKIDSFEVTASNSKAATQSNCSVAPSNRQASCEGLSPYLEYNISIRACSDNRGCGEPAILTVTTLPGRKLRGPSLKVNVEALHISLTRTVMSLSRTEDTQKKTVLGESRGTSICYKTDLKVI